MVDALYCSIKFRLKLGTIVTRKDNIPSEDTRKNLMRLKRFAAGKTFSSDGTLANLVPYCLININMQILKRLIEEARVSK